MSDKPRALELAELFELVNDPESVYREAASELRRLVGQVRELREALSFYADACDATETTPCGYEGQLCCKRARTALNNTKDE